MKWAIYNLLFAAVYPFLLPGFLLRMLRRGGYAARFWDRFALYPESVLARTRPSPRELRTAKHESRTTSHEPRATRPVWIHAVSVGEVQVAGQLMREWRKVEPEVRFVFSTTSSTGWKIAEKELREGQRSKVKGQTEDDKFHCPTSNLGPSTCSEGAGDILIYNPLDFPNFVKSALKTFRPRALVLTESEIWPNFIRKAKQYGIPVYLINARVSDRSAPRYAKMKWFFGDVFSCFSKIFAQSQLDAERLVAAGAPASVVEVTGSFKFDVAHRNEEKERELAEWIFGDEKVEGIGGGGQRRAKILLGGSTWPGEDVALLKIYKSILDLDQSPSLDLDLQPRPKPLLVLAPRHFEKADAVEANIRAAGFDCIRRSRNESFDSQPSTSNLQPVFLADTTGELMGLYGIADVVFVGKSLCAHGSQNMIEPCLCGKPTYVGPYTENFRPVMSDLLAANAIIQVKDEAELAERIVNSFRDPSADLELGQRARAAVENRCGVVAKCLKAIRSGL